MIDPGKLMAITGIKRAVRISERHSVCSSASRNLQIQQKWITKTIWPVLGTRVRRASCTVACSKCRLRFHWQVCCCQSNRIKTTHGVIFFYQYRFHACRLGVSDCTETFLPPVLGNVLDRMEVCRNNLVWGHQTELWHFSSAPQQQTSKTKSQGNAKKVATRICKDEPSESFRGRKQTYAAAMTTIHWRSSTLMWRCPST